MISRHASVYHAIRQVGRGGIIPEQMLGAIMATRHLEREPLSPYLSTDTEHEAVRALEATAQFLEEAESDPTKWKWAIIALHNAVQGFMVLALQGTWNVTVLRREQRERKLKAQQDYYRARKAGDEAAANAANEIMLFGEAELAPFEHLYARIKSPDYGMRQFMESQHFTARPGDDQCIECLNDLRNEFIHFVPSRRRMLLTRFPAVTEAGLYLISFLLRDSKNIHWFHGRDRQNLKPRAENAIDRCMASLTRINKEYADLPRPAAPACGADLESVD